MPIRASKRNSRQRNAQDLDFLPSTSFQRLDTEKNSHTEKQISEITQQFESRIASNVKDEIRKSKNTILKALSFLSENSLEGNITSMSAETAA